MGLLVVGWIPYVGMVVGKVLFGSMWLLNRSIIYTEQLPHSILKPLMTTGWELLLLYALIIFGICLLIRREKSYGWLLAVSAVLLVSSAGLTNVRRKEQRLLIVHFVPHQSAISFVQGKSARLVTKDPMSDNSREVRFYVRNTWDSLGVSQITYSQPGQIESQFALHQNRDFTLIHWQGKIVLIINRLTNKLKWRLPAIVDYLIISRNALQNWDQLRGRVVARKIIFDDSNKTPLTDRLLLEARERGIQCHSVRQQGAFLIHYNPYLTTFRIKY